MKLKPHYSDYTELEFLEFIKEIYRANTEEPDSILDPLLDHFSSITEHPSGTDLIYWPEVDGLDTPEEILRIIKEWRAANQKPGFKTT